MSIIENVDDDDTEFFGWGPGQYVRQAAEGAKTWYPGQHLVVGPMERLVDRTFGGYAKYLPYAVLGAAGLGLMAVYLWRR